LFDVEEIRRIRGFEDPDGTGLLDSLRAFLSMDDDRTVLDLAPAAVLASLPGFTAEAVARLLERRIRAGPRLAELSDLAGELSPASRDSLIARHADLVALVAGVPEAWTVTARARGVAGERDGLSAAIEIRIVHSGPRAAIVRRRVLP
jgi:hypothetical protein